MKIDIRSEIGELEGVILHTPGPEVENMTPKNAERALYSDILNLSVAQKEYEQLVDLLNTVTQTYQVRDPRIGSGGAGDKGSTGEADL